MGNKKRQSRGSPSHKDIALHFVELCNKLGEQKAWPATQEYAQDHGVRVNTLRRAADYLVEEYGDKRMQILVEETHPRNPRGRTLPSVGEWRDYIMQETAGRDFLRIPGRHTGVKKGGAVRVGFLPGRKIVIIPRPPRRTSKKRAA